MFVMRGGESAVLTTTVEEWMAEQEYTEVFNFSNVPISAEEMAITRVLDSLLGQLLNHIPNIDRMVAKVGSQKLIQGRIARPGEQSLGAALGTAYDSIFKDLVLREMEKGKLRPYANRLVIVNQGDAGPDIYMTGACMVAWDVTSRGSIQAHIDRDVYGRAFNRYYLLIWDSPRTESTVTIRRIAKLQQNF